MKAGDLVSFPCCQSNYHYKTGVLLAIRDNPADVRDLKFSPTARASYFYRAGPRQIADVLYNGTVETCWLHNVKEVKNGNKMQK